MTIEYSDSHYYAVSSGNSLTDVSGQPLGLIFKGQESKKKGLLTCNWDYAYTNEFPVTVEDNDVDKLRTIAQEAI
jgi:hypothetical protein